MNSKVCPTCGNELADGAKFCFFCGNPVSNAYVEKIAEKEAPSSILQDKSKQAEKNVVIKNERFLNITNTKNLKDISVYTSRNFFQRLINIMTKPSVEWKAVGTETPNRKVVLFGYVLILALLPVVASLVKYGLIGYDQNGYTYINWVLGLRKALTFIVSAVGTVYLMAKIFDYLAPSFDSEVNIGRSMQLSAYAFTPNLLATALIFFYTKLNIFAVLIGMFSTFLIYKGAPILKRTPKEMLLRYTALSSIIMEFLFFVTFSVTEIILKSLFKLIV